MRFVCTAARMLAILSVLVPPALLAQAPGLSVTNYQFVGEEKISRTEAYVTYRADLINNGAARTAVTASVTSLASTVQVIPGQGNLHFSLVPANGRVTSSNTFTIYVNRIVDFNFASLQWTFLLPVANAGPNQTAKIGVAVLLNGSGSSNPSGVGSLTYSWAFTSRPPGSSSVLQNPTSVSPSFVPDLAGVYAVRLTLDNGAGADSATVTVSTNNSAPVANAGPNQTVALFALITLNGSGSSDVDGDQITHAWTLIARPAGSGAVLFGANTVSPTFAADKPGNYVAQLTVNDGLVNSTPTTVSITTQNTPPVANAGPSQAANFNSLVQLNGAGSTDVDGDALTYQWSLITRPAGSTATLSSATIVNPTFAADREGTFVAQLTVHDGKIASSPATITITTNAPTPPTANAGPNQTVARGSTVTLNGSGSDLQGLSLSYQWSLNTRPAGSIAALSSTTNVHPTFVADRAGTYVAQLMVNNGSANSAPATVTVTTTNTAPVANAGPNQTATVGGVVTLNGSGSSDSDLDPLTYSWSFTSKPAGSSASLSPATVVSPAFLVDLPGTYIAQLIVNDGFANSNPATVTITAGSNIITLSPSPLNLTTFAPGTLTITLGSPAGANGLTVNLAITDTSIAFVPPNVLVPANSTTATVLVTPSGTVGGASILATATGFNSALVNVSVSVPSISIALDAHTVGHTRTMNGTLTLSAPAPVGGSSINISSNPVGIVTLPLSVNIASGTSTGTFTITGAAIGSTTIIASSPGYISGSAAVNVGALGAIVLQPNVTVGPSQSVAFPITLAIGAPVGGVTVTLTSSDPTKVTVSPATVFIAAFAIAPLTQPQVTGVNLGSAAVSASAPGFNGDSQTVLVNAGLAFVPQTLTMGTSATQNLTLTLSSPAPGGGFTVNLSSSNTAVANVPSAASFPGNTTSIIVPVTSGTSAGSAVIHASSLPALAGTTANVTVVNFGAIVVPSSISLGLGQSTGLAITLPSAAPAGGVTLTFVSSDPSKVSVIPGSTFVAAGLSAPASQPQLNGLNAGTSSITVSGPGYSSGVTLVQVGTSLSFSPASLTINPSSTQNISLNLSSPAPAGGLVVNLSSSNTAAVTVPLTATFAANTTTVNVPVTSVGGGSSTIHASALPNIADTTANITVASGGSVAVPPATALGLGQPALFPVTLSVPAPAGGVTVTLGSSDSSRVTVSPATVAIAAGQTIPAVQPQVNGINIGAASITASAPGYASASGAVQVTATVSFSPQLLTVAPGDIQSLTLNLSGPAPAGGLTVILSSSNPAAATVPATATFLASGNTVNVPVSGVSAGASTIHASALPGIPDATASVNVQTGIILPANVSVPLGEFAPFPLTLSMPAPAGGVFVMLASSDTSKVTVSPLNVIIPEGQTAPTVTPKLSGIAFGTATITATAFGFATASQQVQVGASLNFFPANMTIAGPASQNINLTLSAPAPAGGMVISLSSTNSGVASVPASVIIPAFGTSVNVPVAGNAVGTATLTASSGLPGVANATASVTVTSPGAIGLPSSLTLGLGQTAAFPITLGSPAPVGGVTVTLVSSDTEKLTISTANVFIAQGAITPAVQPQLSGLDVGAVTISASAPGYAPGSVIVKVTAIMVFSPQNLFITGNGTAEMISLALSASAPLTGLQIFLTSSNTSVATVPDTYTFYPDGSAFTTLAIPVTSVGGGTAVIRATSSAFVPDATANVTVSGPAAIVLPSNLIVGPNQSTPLAVNLATPAPAGGVTVTLNSSDTTKVTVSPATVSITAGQTMPAIQPQVTGGNLGSASINASAPGYTPATVSVRVGVTVTFSPSTVTIAGTDAQSVTLNLSSPAPPSGLTINLSSSDTNVATVPATVTFPANATSAPVAITPGSLGSATIHASALPDVADATVSVVVTVPGGIGLPSNVTVNLGQSVPLTVTLPSPAPPTGVTVNLNSSDTSKVTVSPSFITIDPGQTSPSAQPQVTGVEFGTATITASAPGFITGVAPVRVTATLTFTPSNLFIGVGVVQAVTLSISSPAPAGGLTIDLSSSNPAVATLPFVVTFPANATSVSVAVTGVALGSTVLHASAPPNIGDATANVTVGTPGTLILPTATTLALGQTAEFAVGLPTPAPPGGVTITLISSNPSRVTISPASVSIAAGQTAPATQPQITGVNLGNVMIDASAPGYTPASVAARVIASIVFSPDTLTLSGQAPQNLTLTLSAPAPAGGLTINFSSSNTGAATVVSSATLATNATSLNVLVTPVAPGSTVITASAGAPNIAEAIASVTVTSAGTINLPIGIAASLSQSTAFLVSLSQAAPVGGVTITLSSSDTGKATVSPATVSIAAGQISPPTPPQVTGVNVGSATITAAAAGYASATTLVQVGATAAFTPPVLSMSATTTQYASLSLSAPAPAGGVNIRLSSTNQGVATVPPVVTILGGDTKVSVPVSSLLAGSTVIHAFGTNIPDTTLDVTVTPPSLGTIAIGNATVGQNLEKAISIAIPNPAPATRVRVVLTSNDPSKVLLAGRPGDAGAASLTVMIDEGVTSLSGIYLQGLTLSGSATVTAAADGYTSGVATVTLSPSGFILIGPNGMGVPSFVSSQGVSTTLTVSAARLDAAFNFVETQLLRGGATASVTISSSDSSVGAVTITPLNLTGGTDSATTQFIAANPGTTSVSAVVPAGFSQPAQAANSLIASVTAAGLIVPNVSVGKNLENSAHIALNGAPAGELTITLTSNDPSRMLLSKTATGAGLASIDVKVQGGSSTSLDFFVHGLASSGSVTYTATATGFGSNTGTVTLFPSGIVIAGPFGFGNPLITTNNAVPSEVTVATAMLGGASGTIVQALAGGLSLNINVTSSNTAAGEITSSPVTIAGGSVSASTQFQPHNAGTTILTPDVPPGFSAAPQFGSVTATVTIPGIAVTDGIPVGQKLQIIGTVLLGQAAPAGGLSLTLTSNNSGALLISASPSAGGSAAITINVPPGQTSAIYYLQAVGNSGTATYTATAAGYNSRTGSVPLTPSGVVISGPFGLGLSFFSASVSAGGTTPVFISMAQLNPSTNAYANTQQLAGGQSVSISLGNLHPGIGTVVSPVTITGGNDTVVSPFTPVSQGSTQITVIAPAGYTPSTSFTLLNAQVNP